MYATLFSGIALLLGSTSYEIWKIYRNLVAISLPFGLLVGYNAWVYEGSLPTDRSPNEVEMGPIGYEVF